MVRSEYDDYHIWDLYWSAEHMSVSVDGNSVGSVAAVDGTKIFTHPHYLILNIAVCGAAYCGGPAAVPINYTAYASVDYIRLYDAPLTQ